MTQTLLKTLYLDLITFDVLGSRFATFNELNIWSLPIYLCDSASKRVFMQKLSHKNKFALHKSEHVGGTHFHVNGFARILVLKQKQNVTQKWPMDPSNPPPPKLFVCQCKLHPTMSYPKTGLVVQQVERTLCQLHSIPTKTKKIRQLS